MNLSPIYVPILKWKQGEQGALKELDDSIKDKIIPLIEITPDFEVTKFEDSLSNWDNRYFYFDVLQEVYEEKGGEIYFELLNQCDPEYVIPVVFLSDDEEAIKEAWDYSSNGIAIRITSDDLDELEENISKITKYIDINDVDLIIDLKDINENNFSEKKIVARALFQSIPDINLYRRIILSSSAFPQYLSGISRYKIYQFKRYDYQLWEFVKKQSAKHNINLIYSDYCISAPGYFEYKPYMKLSHNLRYTSEDSFIIIKGETIKKGGLDSENVIQSCKMLINDESYSGKDYSWGDNYIYTRCNDDVKNFGNLSTWRKVGTNHHITIVINQLSNPS